MQEFQQFLHWARVDWMQLHLWLTQIVVYTYKPVFCLSKCNNVQHEYFLSVFICCCLLIWLTCYFVSIQLGHRYYISKKFFMGFQSLLLVFQSKCTNVYEETAKSNGNLVAAVSQLVEWLFTNDNVRHFHCNWSSKAAAPVPASSNHTANSSGNCQF